MKINFNGSPNPTLGVELELQIIDPETKNLVSGAQQILEKTDDPEHVKAELIQSTIESALPGLTNKWINTPLKNITNPRMSSTQTGTFPGRSMICGYFSD